MRRWLVTFALVAGLVGCTASDPDAEPFLPSRSGVSTQDTCSYGFGCNHERGDPACNAYPYCLSKHD